MPWTFIRRWDCRGLQQRGHSEGQVDTIRDEPREPRPLDLVRLAPHCFDLTGGIVIGLPTAHSYVGTPPLREGSVGATPVQTRALFVSGIACTWHPASARVA